MNSGKFVFSQIVQFLPQRIFDGIVEKHKGNYRVKHFTCWNQMLCMIFGQLSNRESLRDLNLTINAHRNKTYHLGFGHKVAKSTLADANENRSWLIYQDFAYYLIGEARKICIDKMANDFSFSNPVYAVDSSTIDLCLNLFWWAKFKTTKAGIKLHTQIDVRTAIPVFVYITEAAQHDVNAMDALSYEPGSYYIFDRGYLDFERLFTIHNSKAYFVIRAKSNTNFKRMYSKKVNKDSNVIYDQLGKLDGFYTRHDYTGKIRRIKYYDAENNRNFIFLTNNLEIQPEEVAFLYKNRWKVELFFKFIKQHLKIKSFWGYSENAVKTQVYIAMITYTLISIIHAKLKIKFSIYETLQIFGASLLDKSNIRQLITDDENIDTKDNSHNQLKLFDF